MKGKEMKNLQTNSDLRQLIDGTKGKELSEIAQEYKVLEAKLTDMSTRFNELKDIIKQLGEGKFETSEYTFDLYTRQGSLSIDKKVVEQLYPEVFKDERIWKQSKNSLVLDKVERKS